jgi:hypothetical protein
MDDAAGIDDLQARGPLIVLQARTEEAARSEADQNWKNRATLDSSGELPTGYRVFNEIGLILFDYQAPKAN